MTTIFQQTAKDYFEFNYYSQWSSPEKKSQRLKYRLIMFSIVFFMPFLYGHKLNEYGIFEYCLGLMAIVFALLLGPWTKLILKMRSDKVFKDGKNINLIGHRRIDFTDSKVCVKSDTEYSEIEWKAFEKLGESDEYLFLFMAADQALLIPKKQLTEMEIKELKEIIAHKLP